MKHLDDDLLNEYLDGALDAEAQSQVETHLSACGQCRERCTDLQTMFAALSELPERPLQRNLAPAVLRALRPASQAARISPWLAAQSAIAVLLLALSLPFLTQWSAEGGRWMGAGWQALTGFVQNQLEWLSAFYGTVSLRLPVLPELISLPLAGWALVLGCSLAAWLLGNRLLLQKDSFR